MKNNSILSFHPLYYLLLLVITSSIYSIINQSSGHAVDVTTIIDGGIPFIKEFVVPYLLWYPYIYGLLIYYCFVDRKHYFVGLGSLISETTLFSCILPVANDSPASRSDGQRYLCPFNAIRL